VRCLHFAGQKSHWRCQQNHGGSVDDALQLTSGVSPLVGTLRPCGNLDFREVFVPIKVVFAIPKTVQKRHTPRGTPGQIGHLFWPPFLVLVISEHVLYMILLFLKLGMCSFLGATGRGGGPTCTTQHPEVNVKFFFRKFRICQEKWKWQST
jgi:hypothetical protein